MSRSSSHSRNSLPPTAASARIRIATEGVSEREHERDGPGPCSLSLLSARRPSWAPAPYDHPQDRIIAGLASYRDVPTIGVPGHAADSSSPEIDEGNLRKNFRIDMKDLVGDAVGNMSISPMGRDIVLAARRGLFIIDLEAPLEIPRFLPQGGTWDVADVQWNPHRLHAQYIVSTSSEKLLIWNLLMPGRMSIQHILRSHYRAITDINWHTFEPDMVSSVGIDAWIWTWDLRKPDKPVLGLCAFNAGGTQVKWNRQDPNVLASSHMDEVLIWDRRKGSLPTARIRAHNAKIYGIDWAHARVNDIITCSLDKSIKVWNVREAASTEKSQPQPSTTIATRYPVWRARDLPFGRGVLSLPQRGETSLEMWGEDNSLIPATIFEGHTDVVKEFVWRKGGAGDEYQLITWSKDRTLRFWPVDPDTMEKVGCKPSLLTDGAPLQRFSDHHQSFRLHPESLENVPTMSAPIGSRSILAEVRARPPFPRRPTNPVLQPHHGSAARGKSLLLLDSAAAAPHLRNQLLQRGYSQNQPPLPTPGLSTAMTRGNVVSGKSSRMDALGWLASVSVNQRRDGSSSSRVSSHSTASPKGDIDSEPPSQKRKRSASKTRDGKDGDGVPQNLQDEITTVLTKLSSAKIRLEKHELTKRRTCTLGLYGPWGKASSVVFVRISFRFPKSYPHTSPPEGSPEIELERNPLIPIQNRAFMLRRLRTIRERRRPCLEACLRFLLFCDEENEASVPVDIGSGSSSEDESSGQVAQSRQLTVSILRNNKNLPEPRTSQGVFGPNGELVCFFRATPRVVRYTAGGTTSSANRSRSPPSSRPFHQPPSLLSDAIRRLEAAAVDQRQGGLDFRRSDESDHTLRIMTNLLTFSRQKYRRDSDPAVANDVSSNVAALSAHRSTVYIKGLDDMDFSLRKVGAAYIFEAADVASICATNARIAREHGQFGQERVFKTLQCLFPKWQASTSQNTFNLTSLRVIEKLYQELCINHDVQMLAMASVILLTAYTPVPITGIQSPLIKEPVSAVSKPEDDYFSLSIPKDARAAVLSPGWPRLSNTSPTVPSLPPVSALSISNSSRASWSSLFNAGSMRQFMSGVQESITTPLDTFSPRLPVPIPAGDVVPQLSHPDSTRRKTSRRDPSSSTTSPISKSWSEAHVIPVSRPSQSYSSGSGRRQASQVLSTTYTVQQKRLVVTEEGNDSGESAKAMLECSLPAQWACHALAYAEVLLRWQLVYKRLELLNAVKTSTLVRTPPRSQSEFRFRVQPVRRRCDHDQPMESEYCSVCGNRSGKPSCSICRLPVKGLSISCGQCLHICHVKCWRSSRAEVCGSGCGCLCSRCYKFAKRDSVQSAIAT